MLYRDCLDFLVDLNRQLNRLAPQDLTLFILKSTVNGEFLIMKFLVKFSPLSLIKYCCVLIALFSINNSIFASENIQENKTEENLESPDSLITIYGDRPISFYKRKVRLAENTLFDLYNELTEVDEFKVICKKRQHSFSKLRTRTCESKFVSKLTYKYQKQASSTTSKRRSGGSSSNSVLNAKKNAEMQEKRKQQIEDFGKLVNSNQKLREHFEELNNAKKLLEYASNIEN